MKFKVSLHSVEFGKAALRKTPKGLDPVDVDTFGGKMLALVDSQMLVETNVHQAVVTSPTITVDHAFRTDSAANDLL